MKMMVMVNGKYMIAVDAESKCSAEHEILDCDVVKILYAAHNYNVSALAFDKKDMKTDYFFECLDLCETISLDRFLDLCDDMVSRNTEFCKSKVELDHLEGQYKTIAEEIERLNKLLAANENEQRKVRESMIGKSAAVNNLAQGCGFRKV